VTQKWPLVRFGYGFAPSQIARKLGIARASFIGL
jgi:hypothetical protein